MDNRPQIQELQYTHTTIERTSHPSRDFRKLDVVVEFTKTALKGHRATVHTDVRWRY